MAGVSTIRADSSTLSPEGRVVVPAGIRKALGLRPGMTLTFRLDGEVIIMTTPSAAVRRLQQMFKDAPRPNASLVEELIAERRAQAAHEE